MKDSRGRSVNARAMVVGRTVYVRVDHARFTAAQLVRHELAHPLIDGGEIDVKAVRRRLAETYTPQDLERWAQAYIEATSGGDLTADEAWVEMICDSYADMNAFADEAVRGEIYRSFLSNVRTAAEAERNTTRGPPTQNAAETGSGERFSIEPGFKDEIQRWYANGRENGEAFVLGTTGDVLQGLGAAENDIYMLGEKINSILADHPEMSIEEIKRIPEILERPALILKSRNAKSAKSNTRMVLFGAVKAENGAPVLAVLDIRPVEGKLIVDDMQKVTSAYTKTTNPTEFVRNSEVMYANKKRAGRLLRSIGFQMPIELKRTGSIGSITYTGRSVNLSGEKFSDVFSEDVKQDFSRESEGYVKTGAKAVMTDARIDYLIADSGAGNSKTYAQKWITSINPSDFLSLTLREESQDRSVFDRRPGDYGKTVDEYDYIEGLKKETRQTPYLAVGPDGAVVGHEGRHRMRALERNGITSAEIVVEFRDDDGRLIKNAGLKSGRLETMDRGVFYNQYGTEQSVQVENIIPLNLDHKEEILASYGENGAVDGDIRYSRETDSAGRELTEQQAEYFKDSKVRDGNGNLIPMYHGTDADFTVFLPRETGSGERFSIEYPTYSESDIKQNSVKLQGMENVAEISGDELGSRDVSLKKRIADFFASLGNNVRSKQFGDVELRNSSVHSEIRHGNTPPKVMTYAAIPDVIQKGVVIYHTEKNAKGLERIVVAAPVYVEELNEKVYVAVMLQRDKTNQRLYLHDVVTETEKEAFSVSAEHLIPTGPNTNEENLYTTTILLNALNVKQEFSRENDSTGRELTGRDIQAIQSIGRKSVNQFSASDIQATESFARAYFEEMGVKSPFFRAWFGDWRANDKTPVVVAEKIGSERGIQKNDDTGWDINVSRKVFSETNSHASVKNREARPYLPYIRDIVKNAVLLDSYGIGKTKSENSVMMHSLYAVADIGNGPEVLKLYVEEMNDTSAESTLKRAYALQNIEKQSPGVTGSPSRVSRISQATAIANVADLFAAVKSMDDNFKPNEASKIVDGSGIPAVLYHQTGNVFTVFDAFNPEYVADLLRDGNILYTRENKNIQELLSQRRQVPKVKLPDVSEGSITDEAPGVKREYSRETEYRYETLAAKPDMQVTVIDDSQTYKPGKEGRDAVINLALQNARNIGTVNENGNVFVRVKDTDTDVMLSRAGLRHGLDRRFGVNAPVTMQAGEILSNAIRINEVIPEKDNISESYVLLGAAKNKNNEPYIVQFVVNRATSEVASVDVLYSANAKTEPAGSLSPEIAGFPTTLTGSAISITRLLDYASAKKEPAAQFAPKSTAKPLLVTGSSISITRLLDYASVYFPDILPESVLRHYGFNRRPGGRLGESALYSRETAQSDIYILHSA